MAEPTQAFEDEDGEARADRGMAPVNKPRTTQFGKLMIWGIAAGATLATVFMFDGGAPQPKVEAEGTQPGDGSERGYRDPRTNALNAGAAPADPPIFPQFAPPSFPKIEPKSGVSSGVSEAAEDKRMSPSERRLTGGVSWRKQDSRQEVGRSNRQDPQSARYEANARAWDSKLSGASGNAYANQNSAPSASVNGASPSTVQNGDQFASSGPDSLGSQLKATKMDGVTASRLASQSLMIARGRLFECILDTAISSMIAGQVRCTVPLDVYSEDGKVVLLDRATEIVGEYRSNLRSAQTRLGILWVRAKTPAGVIIDLASPASDNLGRGGVDGQIDTHFWERFGAAIMLSVLDDALAAAVANSRSNDVFVFGRTQEAGKDAAEIALENSINIPPTLIKNQGETVAVFLARDLDFRSVYGFKQLGVKQ